MTIAPAFSSSGAQAETCPMEEPSRIRIHTAADGLQATADVVPGKALGLDGVRAALVQAGVVRGVDAATCAELAGQLTDPNFACAGVVVARGDAGAPGPDGQLELHFPQALLGGIPRPDGSVDLRERWQAANVGAGQSLARYQPPGVARQGFTVRGQPLPQPKGRDCLPQLGAGVRLDAQTGQLQATRTGVVCWLDSHLLDVVDLHEIRGNVDYATGNVHVQCSTHITGDVTTGFSVTTTRDVVVAGHLTGGSIQAGANATVGGGVSGGHIEARGDIRCRHATGARLHAGGTIDVLDHAVNSQLWGQHVHLTRGRGKLIGGAARALVSIDLREAGAPAAPPTLLAVADPTEERAQLRRLRHAAHQDTRRAVKSKDLMAGRQGLKSGKTARTQMRLGEALARRRRELRARERTLLAQATVTVRGTVHPGVLVRVGHARCTPGDGLRGVRFAWDPITQSIKASKIP